MLGSCIIGVVVLAVLVGMSGASDTEGLYMFLGFGYIIFGIWGGIRLIKIK
jgi:hypothetical protein